ncbi:DUF5305 domain-containing protein [Natrinema salifodinae]|uniref:DUF5305 domain-containing protein n=1 Tax=Natrinema salifodinae TaxID=1202768 RepID=A0A1I0PRG4_9EURY|nr:DUF5305 domain-containing protein [Natrinema salifodinae]SEW16939.1 hypothetical protein SAMN05216285_2853 [Natrinema salifodinae]
MIGNPRIDLLLAEHGRSIAIALAVLGVLSIGATGWAVANPETTTAPQFGEERVKSQAHTSAVVTENGTLWTEGDRITDSSVYLLDASPALTVEPETRLRNETGETLIEDGDVTHELVLRFEAVRDGAAFWNETHRVLRESPTVENGVATSAATIDVEAHRERQRELEREIAGVGSVDLVMELRTEYDTGHHQGTITTETPVVITDEAYWFEGSLSESALHSHRSGTARTTESRSPALIGGLSLLGTLSLAGAALVARRSPTDADAARRRVHEQRYAEWISEGSIPMWIGDYHVSLDTLEDVVDVAIDTNERVVHDRQRGLFAVVNDSVVYYYSDRGRWAETAWPELDLEDQSAVVDAGGTLSADELSELDGSDEFAAPDDPDGFEDDEEVWEQL